VNRSPLNPLRLLSLAFAVALASPVAAVDFGAGMEESSSVTQDTFTQTATLRPWLRWVGATGARFDLKGNLTDTLTVDRTNGNPATNRVSGDLDALSYTQPFDLGSVTLGTTWGRTPVSDFDGTLLSTPLDGASASADLGVVTLKLAAGTTAFLFKSGTNVAVSADDLTESDTSADLTKPSTLWAPPRVVGYAEAAFPTLVDGQSFRVAAAGQADLRKNSPHDGDAVDSSSGATQAPVSMGYAGVGGEGRLAGPLYWSTAGWVGLGSSLTNVSSTWKATTIFNAWGTATVTLVQPSWAYTVAGISVQAGSGDDDGLAPSTNEANGSSPTTYTGWFGISRASTSPVFDAQPGNLVTAKVYWSTKPFANTQGPAESLQVVASALVFAKTTTLGYRGAEGDLVVLWRPASDWGANATVGAFVPSATETDHNLMYLAQLGLNLSF
jgi:hypothetical protein